MAGWPNRQGALGGQVIMARGVVSRWDGTTNVIVSGVKRIDTRVQCPPPLISIS